MDFNSLPGISSAQQYISSAKEYLYNNKTAADAGQKVKVIAADAFVALQGGVEHVKKFTSTYKNELIQVGALTLLATAVAVATKSYLDAPVPVIDPIPDAVPTDFENVFVKDSVVLDQGSEINSVFSKKYEFNPFNSAYNSANAAYNEQTIKAESFFSTPVQEKEVEQKADLPKVVDNDFTPNEFNPLDTTAYKVSVKVDNFVSKPEPKIEAEAKADLPKVVDNGFTPIDLKPVNTTNDKLQKFLDHAELSKVGVQDTSNEPCLEVLEAVYISSKNVNLLDAVVDLESGTADLAYQIPVRDMAVGVKDRVVSLFTAIISKTGEFKPAPTVIKNFETIENMKVRGTKIETETVQPKKKKTPPVHFQYMSSHEDHDPRRMHR